MIINTNTFLGIAANGMATIASKGITVASSVALALVWNDDIGPMLGQPAEKRNALLGRLERRLIDKGMKQSSIETWRKHGIKFATLYGADIERIVNSIRNDETRNSVPSGAEYVQAVAQWAKQKFPTLTDFHNELYARETKPKADKERDAQLALLNKVNGAKGKEFLANLSRIATLRELIMGKNVSEIDRTTFTAEVSAILMDYKPDAEHAAESEMNEAPDMDTPSPTLVPIAA